MTADALERAFRAEWARVLATLARHVGDLGLAEDALKDAFVDAAVAWRGDGVPDAPGAWLTVAARRRAIDRVRRAAGLADRLATLGRLEELDRRDRGHEDPVPDPMDDDRLRLIFTCCHPALAPEARIALTLRAVGGLATPEIASAFLVPEATMAQRLVRAKAKIAAAGIPYEVPGAEQLPERMAGVLHVVYLVFTEGLDPSAGARATRVDLCEEALRLAHLISELVPDEPEALGLEALLVLHDARRAARVDAAGALVTLDRQDRTRWDGGAIERGALLVRRALHRGRPGPYQLEAAIAALHAQAPSLDETDWTQIAGLYAELGRLSPGPVVELNRAVAVSRADGPLAGLVLLAPLLGDPRLRSYLPLHAAHADLLARADRLGEARAAYDRALAIASGNDAQRGELARRRAALEAT